MSTDLIKAELRRWPAPTEGLKSPPLPVKEDALPFRHAAPSGDNFTVSISRRGFMKAAAAALGTCAAAGMGGALWSGVQHWRHRPQSPEEARRNLRIFYESCSTEDQKLLQAIGYHPDEALIARANFDSTLTFSRGIMCPDERRGYHFRENTQAVWIVGGPPNDRGISSYLAPDSPAIREQVARTPGWRVIEGSEEQYNDFGFRSAPPDRSVDSTVVLLGDSFAECPGVSQDQMVSCNIEKDAAAAGKRIQVPNTGHLGYSTKEEYETLRYVCEECCGDSDTQYKPLTHVILTVFANDVHACHDAVLHSGAGDWDTFEKRVGEIRTFCRKRGIELIIAVVPDISQMQDTGGRSHANFQAKVWKRTNMLVTRFVDPLQEMALLDQSLAQELGKEHPLYLEGNRHLSARGARAIAAPISRALLTSMQKSPSPPSLAARRGE